MYDLLAQAELWLGRQTAVAISVYPPCPAARSPFAGKDKSPDSTIY